MTIDVEYKPKLESKSNNLIYSNDRSSNRQIDLDLLGTTYENNVSRSIYSSFVLDLDSNSDHDLNVFRLRASIPHVVQP